MKIAIITIIALINLSHSPPPKVITEVSFPAPPKMKQIKPIKAPKYKKIDKVSPIVQKSNDTASIQAPSKSEPKVQAGCGDNEYANYIYMHESGCNLRAQNAGGCLGIGQACPGSKLTAVCPNLDYACQNKFFSSYAIGRYGSWQGAYNFWLSNHWW